MKIVIGGDIVPTINNVEKFENADVRYLIGEKLEEIIQSADFSIFNLEVPLVDKKNPISKCGPNLIAPTKTINGLKAINKHFFGLANNHILDQGTSGLYSTMELLKQNNIAYAGAGKNLQEACRPYIFEKDELSIGVYCCAEHEFTIATEVDAGANPYDPLYSFDHVLELKKQCDFVIVLFHGGKEHYRYPSPDIQRIFRRFSEKGADLIIAQHTHCIGCYEEYNGSFLIYGQGNFLFSMKHDEFWDSSLLVEVEIEKNKPAVMKYYPIISEGNRIYLAEGEQQKNIQKQYEERSQEIKNSGFVAQNYCQYARRFGPFYAKIIRGEKNFLKRVFLHFFRKTFSFFYNKKRLLALLNFIECEAHRELTIQEIKRCLKDDYK